MTRMEEEEFRRRMRAMSLEEKMIALEEMPRFLIYKECTVRGMADAMKSKAIRELDKTDFRKRVDDALYQDFLRRETK